MRNSRYSLTAFILLLAASVPTTATVGVAATAAEAEALLATTNVEAELLRLRRILEHPFEVGPDAPDGTADAWREAVRTNFLPDEFFCAVKSRIMKDVASVEAGPVIAYYLSEVGARVKTKDPELYGPTGLLTPPVEEDPARIRILAEMVVAYGVDARAEKMRVSLGYLGLLAAIAKGVVPPLAGDEDLFAFAASGATRKAEAPGDLVRAVLAPGHRRLTTDDLREHVHFLRSPAAQAFLTSLVDGVVDVFREEALSFGNVMLVGMGVRESRGEGRGGASPPIGCAAS